MDRILLVEDDQLIAESLVMTLRLAGFETTHAPTLKAATAALATGPFAVILLDVNLPDGSGFDFCRKLRETENALPVIILTAKTDEESAVKGFSSGATDYIRKPFGSQELLARMKRLMNRELYDSKALSYDALKINAADRRVLYGSTELTLTTREYDVLLLLVKRAGGLLSKENILAAIDEDGSIFDGTLTSHISNLRLKLKKASNGALNITSVYGQGYRLEKK